MDPQRILLFSLQQDSAVRRVAHRSLSFHGRATEQAHADGAILGRTPRRRERERDREEEVARLAHGAAGVRSRSGAAADGAGLADRGDGDAISGWDR